MKKAKKAKKAVKKKPILKKVKEAKIVKKAKKPTPKKKVRKPAPPPARYFEAVGKRKTAVARVRLFTRGEKVFLVNEKPFTVYFPTLELQQIATASLRKMRCLDSFRVLVKVRGGGLNAQAEALRHGISRALTLFNPDFRKRLRSAGYLTRDARKRERKKFGLKRARRAPQWSKR
ncbi:MAG: 30S ribosomal protein S9 [Candidatus Pacebacteria bacterium]|nr:30S ribosomal protein S9 [Candidatus Paceibacterota bacterium]